MCSYVFEVLDLYDFTHNEREDWDFSIEGLVLDLYDFTHNERYMFTYDKRLRVLDPYNYKERINIYD